jgi:hypothetical protein
MQTADGIYLGYHGWGWGILRDVITKPEIPPTQRSLTPDNSDSVRKGQGQIVANVPELLRYAFSSWPFILTSTLFTTINCNIYICSCEVNTKCTMRSQNNINNHHNNQSFRNRLLSPADLRRRGFSEMASRNSQWSFMLSDFLSFVFISFKLMWIHRRYLSITYFKKLSIKNIEKKYFTSPPISNAFKPLS